MLITNLRVSVVDNKVEKLILDIDHLDIMEEQKNIVLGPNGSGKSTLAQVIVGNPDYIISSGEIIYKDQNILSIGAHERAKLGIFMTFQYPLEVPGVNYFEYLKLIYDQSFPDEKMNVFHFRTKLREILKQLDIDEVFINRNLNEGFSGGEKKKMEIVQLLLLKPKFLILDEIDSGLDIYSLDLVLKVLKEYINENHPTVLAISHYSKIFDYIEPDNIIVMKNGNIHTTGGMDLARKITSQGNFDI